MTDDLIMEKLQGVGLSDKESRVYLMLLKHGDSTASHISETTGIIRATAYPVLQALESKGLVTPSTSFTVTKYSANTLTRYRETMRSEVDRFRRLRREIEDSVTSLRKQYSSARVRPRIAYLEGKLGIRRAFEMTFTSKEKYMRVVSSAKKIFSSLPGYLPQYIVKRLYAGIAMKGIHPTDVFSIPLIRHPLNRNDMYALIRSEDFKFEVDIAIFDNQVGYMSHEKLYAVSIQSEKFADVLKRVYDLAWLYCERISLETYPRRKQIIDSNA